MADTDTRPSLLDRLLAPLGLRPQPPLKQAASGQRHMDQVAPDPDPASGAASTEALVDRAADPTAPPRGRGRTHG